jgi:hypothetical protein
VAVILEVKEGRLAGKKIQVRAGQKIVVGRSPEQANFAVPHDSYMSGKHFVVELGPHGCRIEDRKSSNGTFLNGSKITEAMLADGDEVRSGKTIFVVRMAAETEGFDEAPTAEAPVAEPPAPPPAPAKPARSAEPAMPKVAKPAPSRPSVAPKPPAPRPPAPTPADVAPAAAPLPPRPAAPPATPKPSPRPEATPAAAAVPKGGGLVIGSWTFGMVPEGWEAQGEFGIQHAPKDEFPTSVVATDEALSGATLQRYVEAQVAMLRQYLPNPQIEASLPPTIPGAEETVALDVHYSTKDDQVIFIRRIFARQGQRAGALTLTTLEKNLENIRPALDAVVAGVSFQPKD